MENTILFEGIEIYYDQQNNDAYVYSNACGGFELLKWVSDETKEKIKEKYKQEQKEV